MMAPARPWSRSVLEGACAAPGCDGGYLPGPDDGVVECECRRVRLAAARLDRACVPFSMAGASTFQPPSGPDKNIWKEAHAAIKACASGERLRGFTLHSTPGTGKSTLLVRSLLWGALGGMGVRYLSVRDAITEIRGDEDGPQAFAAALRRLRDVELLALDEVGGQRVPFARELVAAVICGRVDDGRPTLIATTHGADELGSTLGVDVADRICRQQTLVLEGRSLR